MDNLRLILILIGVLILAGIVLFHNHGKARKRRRATRRREPAVGDAPREEPAAGDSEAGSEESVRQPSLGSLEADEHPLSEGRREPVLSAEPAASAQAADGPGPGSGGDDNPDSEKIVIVYLKRRNEKKISGVELLDAALKAGLVFGEMNIFHRRQEGGERSVFSMADISNPGTFDPTSWNLYETPGVTLFLTLPGPLSGLDAWDAMLATGQRLAELLDADLLDDEQCLVTRQRIAQIREEMREYDRKRGIVGSTG